MFVLDACMFVCIQSGLHVRPPFDLSNWVRRCQIWISIPNVFFIEAKRQTSYLNKSAACDVGNRHMLISTLKEKIKVGLSCQEKVY